MKKEEGGGRGRQREERTRTHSTPGRCAGPRGRRKRKEWQRGHSPSDDTFTAAMQTSSAAQSLATGDGYNTAVHAYQVNTRVVELSETLKVGPINIPFRYSFRSHYTSEARTRKTREADTVSNENTQFIHKASRVHVLPDVQIGINHEEDVNINYRCKGNWTTSERNMVNTMLRLCNNADND